MKISSILPRAVVQLSARQANTSVEYAHLAVVRRSVHDAFLLVSRFCAFFRGFLVILGHLGC